MSDTAQLPISVRVALAHAAIQHLADAEGIQILHIKGPAVHESLLKTDADGNPSRRRSTDVDVLCRHSDVVRVDKLLRANGWRQVATFTSGSIFEHAATYWHDMFGYLDLHRLFPGVRVEPEAAFNALYRNSFEYLIANWPCRVPSIAAQRMVLVLHAGRGAGRRSQDVQVAWFGANDAERTETRELVAELGAEVGFAAGIGELDNYADSPEYELWASLDPKTPWLRQFRGRWRAASGVDRATLVWRVATVNRDALAMRLGHRPNRREVLSEQMRRCVRLAKELWCALRRGNAEDRQ